MEPMIEFCLEKKAIKSNRFTIKMLTIQKNNRMKKKEKNVGFSNNMIPPKNGIEKDEKNIIDCSNEVLKNMNKLKHLRRNSCICANCGNECSKQKRLNLLLISSKESKFLKKNPSLKSSINLSLFGIKYQGIEINYC